MNFILKEITIQFLINHKSRVMENLYEFIFIFNKNKHGYYRQFSL